MNKEELFERIQFEITAYKKTTEQISLPRDFINDFLFDFESFKNYSIDQSKMIFFEIFHNLVECDENNIELKKYLQKQLELKNQVKQNPGEVIKGKGLVAWNVESVLKDSFYWDSLKRYWQESSNLPVQVIDTIDKDTSDILSWSGNPQDKRPWRKQGLVLGYVQSGKTTNYSALIAKALDVGYKHVVVLAGMTNSLRRQTQERLDETILGRSSSSDENNDKVLPIQRYRNMKKHPKSYTSESVDFSSAQLNQKEVEDKNSELFFVVKKNTSVLQSLVEKLEAMKVDGDKLENPLLIIDDEADNASIDTSTTINKTSAINLLIRKLLQTSSRVTYIGYTATPFANIFIDPDVSDDELKNEDLFPKDFIKSLDAPDNYIGTHLLFDKNQKLHKKCVINLESEETKEFYSGHNAYSDFIPCKHKGTLIVNQLPKTLKDSVLLFLIFCAWRLRNNETKKHASMLVNVSLLNSVQLQIKALISEYLEEIRKSIPMALHQEWRTNTVLNRMNAVFYHYKYDQDSDCEFSDLLPFLAKAIDRVTKVHMINMRGDQLRYPTDKNADGMFVIAVGGLALSRGLTLEGLVISYIIRNVGAKDTLLQTGRWFGYRDGYKNLCRIFLPHNLEEKFLSTTITIEELRNDLSRMAELQKSPLDFGLRVRSSDLALQITAKNKIGFSQKMKVAGDYSAKHVQISEIYDDIEILNKNKLSLRKFLESTTNNIQVGKKSLFFKTENLNAVLELVNRFDAPKTELNLSVDSNNILADYIQERRSELNTWNVLLLLSSDSSENGPTPKDALSELGIFDEELYGKLFDNNLRSLRKRSSAHYSDTGGFPTVQITSRRAVGGVLGDDLSDVLDKNTVDKEYELLKLNSHSKVYKNTAIYKLLTKPCLFIHPVILSYDNSVNDNPKIGPNALIYTISLVFPNTNIHTVTKEYDVNKVFAEQLRKQKEEELENQKEVDDQYDI